MDDNKRKKNLGGRNKHGFKSRNNNKKNSSSGMDIRFAQVLNDPRFKTMRRQEKKVQVDSRFSSMLTDKRFNFKSSVDKRGFPVSEEEVAHEKRHLKRVYDVQEDDDHDDKPSLSNEKKHQHMKDATDESEMKDEESSDEDEELSSSSDESLSESEEAVLELKRNLDHKWSELDADALRSEETSPRIAVCNVDWDRLKAKDLFILFNSFKPDNAVIVSVKVYVSRFGKERMAEEALKGPQELSDITSKHGHCDSDQEEADQKLIKGIVHESQDDEVDELTREKLREYQLNRLKYFYAVVECDSTETAQVLYKELDGFEYESSASTLDLRFIPDSEVFEDEELRDECLAMPDMTSYKNPIFISSALQQAKVNLTWDETDPERTLKFTKAFSGKELDEKAMNDLDAFLASNSEDENDDDDDVDETTTEIGTKTVQEKMNKYKLLLLQQEEEEKAGDQDEDLEIEFDADMVDEEMDEDNSTTEIEEDDLPKKRLGKHASEKKGKKKSRKKQEDLEESSGHLGLLVMDEEKEERSHFNYDDIVKNETSKSKKKQKRKMMNKEKTSVVEDNFRFDSQDPRFESVYSRADFNIDPSDPHFKRTPAMMDIMAKKIKNRTHLVEKKESIAVKKDDTTISDPALSRLINSVKSAVSSSRLNRKK